MTNQSNTSRGRLTEAQRALLVEVFNGDDRCSEVYAPANMLVHRGFCVWAGDNRLALTPAGRAALLEQKK